MFYIYIIYWKGKNEKRVKKKKREYCMFKIRLS